MDRANLEQKTREDLYEALADKVHQVIERYMAWAKLVEDSVLIGEYFEWENENEATMGHVPGSGVGDNPQEH